MFVWWAHGQSGERSVELSEEKLQTSMDLKWGLSSVLGGDIIGPKSLIQHRRLIIWTSQQHLSLAARKEGEERNLQ